MRTEYSEKLFVGFLQGMIWLSPLRGILGRESYILPHLLDYSFTKYHIFREIYRRFREAFTSKLRIHSSAGPVKSFCFLQVCFNFSLRKHDKMSYMQCMLCCDVFCCFLLLSFVAVSYCCLLLLYLVIESCPSRSGCYSVCVLVTFCCVCLCVCLNCVPKWRSLEERVPRLEREKTHAEGELMKAVNALSERESALSEVRHDIIHSCCLSRHYQLWSSALSISFRQISLQQHKGCLWF